MFEIRIKKKKSMWPFGLICPVIKSRVVNLWNSKKKKVRMVKPKVLSESNINQSPEVMIPINIELFFLSDLTEYELAINYPEIKGWAVWDTEKHLIGTVDDLLVNKEEKKAAYLVVEVDASVIEKGKTPWPFHDMNEAGKQQNRAGDDHLFIPVERVVPESENKILITNQISYESIVKARRFSRSARTMPAYPVDQFRTQGLINATI